MSIGVRAEGAFLDVERSVTGRRWLNRANNDRDGLALSQRFGLPEVVGRLMSARGIGVSEAERFLAPSMRDQLPDPSVLRDMDRAAARLVTAVREGEPIAVFGDYDVDGATSSALLAHFFAAVGVPLRIYIPDRINEGYGPNRAALLRLRAEGIRVVITVDCGILAFEPLAAAAEAGLDIIVVDHHVAEPRLPAAHAIVNPNRLDDDSGLGQLAAVGVAFLLAVAVNRALRDAGWYRDRQEPNLLSLLDLVAVGTVCDVTPLTGLNRALVTQGDQGARQTRQHRPCGPCGRGRSQGTARCLSSRLRTGPAAECRRAGRGAGPGCAAVDDARCAGSRVLRAAARRIQPGTPGD